uniref:Acetylajmalan esterase n=1 Tax=Rauvolfia serpentina TaxID=4060 RepID=AAE_RAUSE|nr:RecName: Full=Acetylajmalan esterase; Flags: Precursor [Rauvolfia serpentina]AAW88320.1 acetylajmalan acetylesterase [Rauvolfia serpentina]
MGFARLLHLVFSLLVFAGITNGLICPFDSIYQLGDSFSDTGNLIRLPPDGPTFTAAHFPYGETFPGTPTGRCSDGRLIIDFIATALNLPLLNPYLQQNVSFRHGVNFAVAGATALDRSFLAARGVQVSDIHSHLSAQLNWFRTYLGSICSTPKECSNKLKNALFILGNIGNNDVNYAFPNRTIEEIRAYVPFITEAVANATREIIRLGGSRVIVPGIFPIGCVARNLNFLNFFPDGDKDDLGCLSSLNNLSIYFNSLFQRALASLSIEFPQAVIIYADYYNAWRFLFRNGPALGSNSTSLLKCCCGIGGPYNYDPDRECGSRGVPVCPNPTQYIQWDGTHFTQAAYRRVAEYVIPGIIKALKCSYSNIQPFLREGEGRQALRLNERE